MAIISLNRYWTEEGDDIVKRYYPIEKTAVFNRLPNRSKQACMIRARLLGVTSKNENTLWTDQEYEILKEYYPKVGGEVSVMLNRSKHACITMAFKLGIKKKQRRKYEYVYKKRNKYVVEFTVDGKRMQFGRFDSEEEAVKVAMQKAKEFGKAI